MRDRGVTVAVRASSPASTRTVLVALRKIKPQRIERIERIEQRLIKPAGGGTQYFEQLLGQDSGIMNSEGFQSSKVAWQKGDVGWPQA